MCGIIKPHALRQSTEILAHIVYAGVTILESKRFWYTRDSIEILYDHMSINARRDIARQHVGLEGLVLLLEAQSISSLLHIAGTESDPQKCSPHTIRARFGIHSDPEHMGSDHWWKNAFHRPIDDREASRDLAYFFPHIK